MIDFLLRMLLACWDILVDAAPFVLFGFLVAGLVKGLLRDATVARHLGGKGIGPVFKAALLGVPLPLCSCGVLPAAVGLKRQGASRGATAAFLISTPETGVDSIAVTYALLDPLMTLARPLAALITAVAAGLLEIFWPGGEVPVKGPIPLPMLAENCCCDDARPDSSPGGRLRAGLRFAFGELLQDIGKWLLLGIVVAGAITALIPDGFLERHLAGGLGPMLLMLVAGVPLYVCASASTPIAAALMLKGLSPGAALVFLLVGPATNSATMVAVARTLGRRSLTIYLTAIAGCSLVLGLGLDWLYRHLAINPMVSVGAGGHTIPRSLGEAAAVLLLVLMARLWWRGRH